MKSSLLRPLLFLLAAVSPFGIFELSAADTSTEATPKASSAAAENPDTPLVVTQRVFTGKAGKPTAATIRNLVDLISERYPESNITVVGVENVVIENLTLQWRRTRQPAPEGEVARHARPPLEGVLNALAEASGRKFLVRSFGPTDFMLASADSPAPPQITEVFNLSSLIGTRNRAGLQEEIRRGEIELEILRKKDGPAPDGNAPHIAAIQYRLEVAKKLLSQPPATAAEAAKFMEKIQDVVAAALHSNAMHRAATGTPAPRTSAPDFQYHAGTNLLVIIGSAEAIDLTRKVIAALEQNP